jgi:DNA-binding MarR family transcriptional regulator
MHAEPDDLLDQVNALMSALKGQLHQALRGEPDPLAPLEARALRYFARHPGSTQAMLAAATGRDKAQVTRLVKEMLARGQVMKGEGGEDRRSFGLFLTETGMVQYKKVLQARRRLAATMVMGLSPQEQAQLSGLLARVQANVKLK